MAAVAPYPGAAALRRRAVNQAAAPQQQGQGQQPQQGEEEAEVAAAVVRRLQQQQLDALRRQQQQQRRRQERHERRQQRRNNISNNSNSNNNNAPRTSHLYCLASAVVAFLAVVTSPAGGGPPPRALITDSGAGGSGSGSATSSVRAPMENTANEHYTRHLGKDNTGPGGNNAAGGCGGNGGGSSSSSLADAVAQAGRGPATGEDDLTLDHVAKAAAAAVASASSKAPTPDSRHNKDKHSPNTDTHSSSADIGRNHDHKDHQGDQHDDAPILRSWSDLGNRILNAATGGTVVTDHKDLEDHSHSQNNHGRKRNSKQQSASSHDSNNNNNNNHGNIHPLLRWMAPILPKPDIQSNSSPSASTASATDDLNSDYDYSSHRRSNPFVSFLLSLIDPAILNPSSSSSSTTTSSYSSSSSSSSSDGHDATVVIDKILTSTPRLIAIANLLLSMTYLLHSALADMFLGPTSTATAAAATSTDERRGDAGVGVGAGGGGGGGNTATAAAAAAAAADMESRTRRRTGRERLGGFLIFKLLLVSAVLLPDTLDLLILLGWYTLLSFLRSLAYLAHETTEHTARSGQPPRAGVPRLLVFVLLSDFVAAACCVALFHGAGWGMVLLLTCDCALLAFDVLCHVARHVGQVLEERHGRAVGEMEERQLRLHAHDRRRQRRRRSNSSSYGESEEGVGMVGVAEEEETEEEVTEMDDREGEGLTEGRNEEEEEAATGMERDDEIETEDVTGGNSDENNGEEEEEHEDEEDDEVDVETESRRLDREMERLEAVHARRLAVLDTAVFVLELLGCALTVCHFLHIWSLHGLQCTLIDGVLALHLHSAISAAGKKISERRNMNRIARDLDGFFDDATELELRKASAAGDVCCICLGTMSTGNVKKVGCGHLYHTHCLREVVERARSIEAAKCPLCRASVVDGTYQPAPSANNNNTNTNAAAAAVAAARGIALNLNNGGGAGGANQQQQQEQPPTQQGVNVDGGGQQDGGRNADGQQLQQQQQQMNQGEHALFRFSTEGILPAWLPLPAFSFEVVRRPPVVLDAPANVNNNVPPPAQERERVVDNNTNNDTTNNNQQQQEQPEGNVSFWRRLLVLAGAIPMSPEEEARAVDQLVDMFPQYDRADLLRELRDRGSAEAVVEAVLVGVFSGVARGGGVGGNAVGAANRPARPANSDVANEVASPGSDRQEVDDTNIDYTGANREDRSSETVSEAAAQSDRSDDEGIDAGEEHEATRSDQVTEEENAIATTS